MIYSYLREDNIFDRYSKSKRYTELLTEPFKEFERIARNRPYDNADPKLPRVTDGTTASIIRKTPKRVVQQLPTGLVESDGPEWLGIIAGFVYQEKILKKANEDYDLIQKCWNVIEGGLTYGGRPTYAPFLNHDGYFCPDLTIPYWGDIFIQKGKKSGYASSYVFLRAWWQPEDIEALIDQEKQLAKSAKERGEKYESSWDLKALEKIKDSQTLKDEDARSPSEEERETSPSGVELVTGFQKGAGATFFTFNPGEKLILRRKKNKDPRGKMPIDWFYGDIDGTNPWGRGLVELVGGLQNLIDSDMQMYQYNRALMLAPPVIKRGNFPKSRVVYEPNRIIDVGSDPGADVKPLEIDTTAIANYPALYGLQKSQLLNLTASPDSSISAEVGNPSFSKTDSGVKQQNAIISVDDNYVRKMFEKWFENWSETAINLYFAERTGVEELQLDKKTADKLRRLEKEGKLQPGFVGEDNKVLVDYDSATPILNFTVDASTSKMKNDQDQLAGLIGLLDVVQNNPVLAQIVPQEKILGAWNKIVDASGVEDPEDLSVDIEEYQQRQQEQAQTMEQSPEVQTEQLKTEQAAVKLEQDKVKLEGEKVKLGQVAAPLIQEDEEDQQIIAHLQRLGVSDDVIQQAIQLIQQGANADEVFQAIGVQA